MMKLMSKSRMLLLLHSISGTDPFSNAMNVGAYEARWRAGKLGYVR